MGQEYDVVIVTICFWFLYLAFGEFAITWLEKKYREHEIAKQEKLDRIKFVKDRIRQDIKEKDGL